MDDRKGTAPKPLSIEGRPEPLQSPLQPPPPPEKGEAVRVVPNVMENADRDKFDQGQNNIASGEGPDDVDHDHKVVVFEQWLEENGAKFPCLEIRKYGLEVRGVHTKLEIGADEIIVQIPLRCLITVEMGKNLPVGQAVLSSGVSFDAPKHIFLMLFMLTDMKRPNTFFKPYYDLLPTTLSNMPIFWSEEELGLLQGSYLSTQVEERRLAIESDYSVICDLYPPFQNVATLEEFKWARMCVCSRNFGLDVGGVRTSALVPYADMLNHYRPRETKWTYSNERGAFTITTLQPIGMGAQVYDSYGQKCNHRFLLNYGFAIEKNEEANGFCPNEVPLELRLDPGDPLLVQKVRFWRMDGPEMRRIRVCVGDNESFRSVLSILRVIVADPQDMAVIEGGSRFAYRTVKDIRFPISTSNERASMQRLMSMVHMHLNAYPSTLEEDREALQGGNLEPFSNKRHAVIQVLGEKVVLKHYLHLAETALACLAANSVAEMEERWRGKDKLVCDYCSGDIFQIWEQDRARGVSTIVRTWGGQMTADPTIV